MPRLIRVLKLTAALAAFGAVVGALVGLVAIGFVYLLGERTGMILVGPVFLAAAFIGAKTGFVLGPIAAWTLMRRVPIWKAIAGTALGAVIGFIVGYWLAWSNRQPLWAMGGTLCGFLVAALLLRVLSPSHVETVPEGAR
jgi:hypothetical protein